MNQSWGAMSREDRIKAAGDGRRDGLTAREIAAAHGTTRGAVVGYWDRHCRHIPCQRLRFGLLINAGRDYERERAAKRRAERRAASDAKPRRTAEQKAARAAKERAERAAMVTLRPVPVPVLVPLEPMPEPKRLALVDLVAESCRWPLGDPQHADFAFCGLERHGERSYCQWHARLAYYKPPKRSGKKRPSYRVKHTLSTGSWALA